MIQGDYNLHIGSSINSIVPGSLIIDGAKEMFKAPCDYNNFINTKTINNDCQSNAFVITGNSTNLTHPFLLSQLVAFKNTSIEPNIIISIDENSSFIYDMFYDSGFSLEHTHFFDGLVGIGKKADDNVGNEVSLDNCRPTKEHSISSDCEEALRNYMANITDKNQLPSDAVKGNVCTASYSISKMSNYNLSPNFTSVDPWVPSPNGSFVHSDIQAYFDEEESNPLIGNRFHDLRAKRKLNELAVISCDSENSDPESQINDGPYVGISWGSDFIVPNMFSFELSNSNELSNIISVESTIGGFAALKADGSIVTWGYANEGGDSSSVSQDVSSGVSNIFSNKFSFAALKDDGSVITWGKNCCGGNSNPSEISGGSLENVSKIFSTFHRYTNPFFGSSYAAIKNDGSVVAWGSSQTGGIIPQNALTNLQSGVVEIFSTDQSFAALKSDGTVVSWGFEVGVNDTHTLSDVKTIVSTSRAFAALKNDGTVFTWGSDRHGGDAGSIDLSNVKEIYGNQHAFAALKNDGSVLTWGYGLHPEDIANHGGDSSSVDLSSGVLKVYSTAQAFAALTVGGNVITWGDSTFGGDSSSVSIGLVNVSEIYSTLDAFAALKTDGSVISWGRQWDVTSSDKSSLLSSGVNQIITNHYAFAAIKDNGNVVTWGMHEAGADEDSQTNASLSNIKKIHASRSAFAALK